MADDERIVRIEDKLDKIVDNIASIDVTLAKQAVSLDYHIKRTTLLEQKIEPIETHVAYIHGILKFIGILSLLAMIAEGLFSVLQYFKK